MLGGDGEGRLLELRRRGSVHFGMVSGMLEWVVGIGTYLWVPIKGLVVFSFLTGSAILKSRKMLRMEWE